MSSPEKVRETGAAITKYGNVEYSDLWYVDTKNKLCFTFTPKGGCSISFQLYLDLLGLLEDALKHDSFVHNYRFLYFDWVVPRIPIDRLIFEGYTFIKYIMNPYIRAVSVFRMIKGAQNKSFREYLKDMINGTANYRDDGEIWHSHPQYIENEENIITKYIKINENETYTIKLHDGNDYIIDVNKYTSSHHGAKTDFKEFCGDIKLSEINKKLPKSYKYFYDDEIRSMVEKIYGIDIEKYKFKFEF
jgi:hypothetical protein